MPSDINEGESDQPSALLFPRRRRDLLQVLGISGAVGLAGCIDGGDTPTPSPTETDTETPTETSSPTPTETPREVRDRYVDSDATDAESLNFLQIADAPSSARIGLTLDAAYAIAPGLEVFPLWLNIESEDKKTWTCTLRENLQWGGNYGQMTAEDWVYMITQVIQTKDNWVGFPSPGEWKRDGDFIPVVKTGKYEFEIRLPSIDPAFALKPIMWGMYCMPKGLLKKYVPNKDAEGLNQDNDVQKLAYSGNLGPYTFQNWSRQSEFVTARNDDYYMGGIDDKFDQFGGDPPRKWTGSPWFDGFTIKVIPEESTRLAALKKDTIDHTGIPETKVKQFEGLDGVNVVVTPQPYNSLLIYNERANGWKPFRKQSVRKALSYAVDKQSIVDNILRGYANVAHTFQPKFSKWYSDQFVEESGVGDTYDPQKARNELESALSGTDYSYDGDTVVGPEGDPKTLNFVYVTGTKTTETTAKFIAQAFGEIGLNVETKGVKFDTLLRKYVQPTSKVSDDASRWDTGGGPFNPGPREEWTSAEQWDMQYGIIFNTYPRTPSSTEGFWIENGGINYYGYEPNADLKSLYDKATKATDEAKRKEHLAKIFGHLSKEQPCNFLLMGVNIHGYRSSVQGPKEIFSNGWDYQTWYFEQQ